MRRKHLEFEFLLGINAIEVLGKMFFAQLGVVWFPGKDPPKCASIQINKHDFGTA